MIKYVQVPIEGYGVIKVAIEPTSDTGGFEDLGIKEVASVTTGGFEDLGLKEDVQKAVREAVQAVTVEATNAFDIMSDTVQAVAYGFRQRLNQIEKAVQPDEVSVEFGLALKADAGVVIAQAGTDAVFKIKLAWKPLSRSEKPK